MRRRRAAPGAARAARLALAALALCALLAEPTRADEIADWTLHCRGCHGADGRGAPGSVPDLRGSVGRFLRVPGGRAYLARVPGAAQSELDDARLAAVLTWMVRRFSPDELPPDFEPYRADEVGRYRAEPLADVAGARRALLRELAGPAR